MTTTEDTIQRAFDRFLAARWKYPGKVQDVVACIDALHAIAAEQQGEIRMLKMRIAELADEEPATVAAEPDDLHPVALKLAEAYRLAWDSESANRPDTTVFRDIRMAWLSVTGFDNSWSNADILNYGLPK